MNTLLWAILAAALSAVITGLVVGRTRSRPGGRAPTSEASPRPESEDRDQAMQIVDHMNPGVLVLKRSLSPSFANDSARALLGLQDGPLPGRLASAEIAEVAAKALTDGEPHERTVDVWFPKQLTLKVQAVPLGAGSSVMLLVQDASEEVRAQRIRTEFVAHASHELKSPVASLQALAEAVNGAVRDDPEAAERFSGKLVMEADRLGKLIADLLDLSRLEDAGRMPDDPCDLGDIARRETERLEPNARGDIVALDMRIEDDLWVKGDAQQLGLLVRNLIENAIQYTQAGGSVSVIAEMEEGSAVLTVADTGVGIPLESQARVFERFYRVDQARSREHGGTGLGLAIVKHVVELHGGSIELTSELGAGSTFRVSFPLMHEHVQNTKKETA